MNIVSSPVIGICGQINWYTKINEKMRSSCWRPRLTSRRVVFCCSGDFGFWLSLHLSHDRVDPWGRLRKERPRDTRGNDHWGIGDGGGLFEVWNFLSFNAEGGLFRKKELYGKISDFSRDSRCFVFFSPNLLCYNFTPCNLSSTFNAEFSDCKEPPSRPPQQKAPVGRGRTVADASILPLEA